MLQRLNQVWLQNRRQAKALSLEAGHPIWVIWVHANGIFPHARSRHRSRSVPTSRRCTGTPNGLQTPRRPECCGDVAPIESDRLYSGDTPGGQHFELMGSEAQLAGLLTGASLPPQAGEIFALAVVGVVFAWVVADEIRRHRSLVRGGAASEGTQGLRSDYPSASPLTGSPKVGWMMSPTKMNEQLFWNGAGWAGKRQWVSGTGWVELEAPPEPHGRNQSTSIG